MKPMIAKFSFLIALIIFSTWGNAQTKDTALDKKVEQFLNAHKRE